MPDLEVNTNLNKPGRGYVYKLSAVHYNKYTILHRTFVYKHIDDEHHSEKTQKITNKKHINECFEEIILVQKYDLEYTSTYKW